MMGGQKFDQEKIDITYVFEYFPRALLAVAEVAMFGAKKYERGGWKTVPDGEHRYDAALGRHILAEYMEGTLDSESGLRHKSHSAWNALAALEFAILEEEDRVRIKNEESDD